MKAKTIAIAILLLTLLIPVSPAAAQTTEGIIIDSHSGNAGNYFIRDHHPSDTAFNSSRGETFRPNITAYLVNITLDLKKSGNPTCTLQVRIYNHNGTFGSTGLPTGTSIANSTTIAAATLGAGFASYNFTFEDDDRIQVNMNQTYVFALVAYGGVLTAANYVIISISSGGAATYEGNHVFFNNGTWHYRTAEDVNFIMYGEDLWNPVGDLIDDAFQFFNITGYMNQAITEVNGLAQFFTESLVNSVQLIEQQFRIIRNIFTWTIRWITRFFDTILTMGGIITGLLNGTGAVVLAWGNTWTYFGIANWYEIIPLIAILMWIDSVAARGETQGELRVFFEDVQTATNIMSYFLSVFNYVASTILDRVFRLFEAIT